MTSQRKEIDIEVIRRSLDNSIHKSILCTLKHMGQGTAKDLLSRPIGTSQASLYRALNALEAEGLINVVSEERKRAITEKTYGLSDEFQEFMKSVFEGNDRDTYRMMVTWEFQKAQTEFDEYLMMENANIIGDMTRVCSLEVNVTDGELHELYERLFKLLNEYMKPEGDGRCRRGVTLAFGPSRGRVE